MIFRISSAIGIIHDSGRKLAGFRHFTRESAIVGECNLSGESHELERLSSTRHVALVLQGPTFAQESDESEVEEIVVTGSRIVRTDNFEDAGHVIPIDEVAIDALAELNVADVLRSSPLNSHGSFNERSGSSSQSNASINLRGLGDWRTLVLVDGTRVPGSPNMAAQTVNINMLPNVAVRRIDILADGASAVYGSDAMAGVVNYVLYRAF